MELKDIEQRAEEYASTCTTTPINNWNWDMSPHFTLGDQYNLSRNAFIQAMTEERERGKRFVQWLFKNDLYFFNDDIFNSFLAEEKELNN